MATGGAPSVRVAALACMLLTAVSCGGSPSTVAGHPSRTSHSDTPAAPAVAPQLNGPYSVVPGGPGTPPATWVFTPCGDGCAQVDMGGEGSGQRGTARYVEKNWTLDVHSTRALQCGDGTYVPGTAHYSWNPDTLQGRYWSTADGGHPCGYQQSLDTDPVPLTLTWAGPPRAGA